MSDEGQRDIDLVLISGAGSSHLFSDQHMPLMTEWRTEKARELKYCLAATSASLSPLEVPASAQVAEIRVTAAIIRMHAPSNNSKQTHMSTPSASQTRDRLESVHLVSLSACESMEFESKLEIKSHGIYTVHEIEEGFPTRV
jgi:hypothetical protein